MHIYDPILTTNLNINPHKSACRSGRPIMGSMGLPTPTQALGSACSKRNALHRHTALNGPRNSHTSLRRVRSSGMPTCDCSPWHNNTKNCGCVALGTTKPKPLLWVGSPDPTSDALMQLHRPWHNKKQRNAAASARHAGDKHVNRSRRTTDTHARHDCC
jgi:hypothetical protein